MSAKTGKRSRLRFWALTAAVVVGAGGACAYVVTRDQKAAAQASEAPAPRESALANSANHGVVTTPAAPASPSTKAAPSSVLPFNAKLSSKDIPVAGGGVRTGGCSGSLVAPDWVVSAGHCFHDLNNNRVEGAPPYHVTVAIGKLKDSDAGGYVANVVDVKQSPINDLALVRLDTAITDITPLKVSARKPAVGQKLQFAGWGSLSAKVIVQSDHLKRGQFRVAKVTSTVLEAESLVPRTVENSPCPDDSGGPFFTTDDDRTGTLVAIVNDGPSCPQPGRETIARVDVVASWIAQQTGIKS
ncbi:trypsin-like serine protease [Actinocrispum sp. NPDC049592]|uniref:S1 family peptidase n=1 Tax=Actinocrispum sp. NPDC049592 TaxID=3154835 RepID=UPI0034226414